MKKIIEFKNLTDITIGQYQEIYSLIESEDRGLEEDLKIITHLTDLTYEELLDYSYNSIQKFQSLISDILNQEMKPQQKFLLDEITYYMDEDTDKWTTGMFVDLYNQTKDQEAIIYNLHIIAAILFRPKKGRKIEPYQVEGLMSRAELFKQKMPISIAQYIGFFFLNLKIKSLQKMKVFLESQFQQAKKMN